MYFKSYSIFFYLNLFYMMLYEKSIYSHYFFRLASD